MLAKQLYISILTHWKVYYTHYILFVLLLRHYMCHSFLAVIAAVQVTKMINTKYSNQPGSLRKKASD